MALPQTAVTVLGRGDVPPSICPPPTCSSIHLSIHALNNYLSNTYKVPYLLIDSHYILKKSSH